jgi:chemotaxis protein MotB
MAGKNETIVIKKVQGGGGHGHHGGAWKVAYADFVTAMMCFFLVMWLMGSDEEATAPITHYFNQANTPYKAGKDPKSDVVNPLGERLGHGDSIQQGLDGLWPNDLVDRPKPKRDIMKEAKTVSKILEDVLEGKIYGFDQNEERVKFSLSDSILFKPGSAELLPEAKADLDVLGEILSKFEGYITIEGHTDETPIHGSRYKNNWELSFARALAVMNYLHTKHKIEEERMTPVAFGHRLSQKQRQLASKNESNNQNHNRRVVFSLSYEPLLER